MTTFTVEQRAGRPWVGVSMTAELAHWDHVNAYVPQVCGTLAAADGIAQGGPICQYRRLQTATDPMDITISVPVPVYMEIGDGFDTGVIPAGRYLIARPEGGPDVLAQTHLGMWEWAGMPFRFYPSDHHHRFVSKGAARCRPSTELRSILGAHTGHWRHPMAPHESLTAWPLHRPLGEAALNLAAASVRRFSPLPGTDLSGDSNSGRRAFWWPLSAKWPLPYNTSRTSETSSFTGFHLGEPGPVPALR